MAVNVNGAHVLESVDITQATVIAARSNTGPIDSRSDLRSNRKPDPTTEMAWERWIRQFVIICNIIQTYDYAN